MTKLNFICTFKSDIVLHSSSNTEGKVDKFDYIAGSNFLGMVARNYKKFGADAFEVFHSGAVRFGDAHILVDNQKTLHIPFSWMLEKDASLKDAIDKKKEQKLYNDHFITEDMYKQFIKDKKQPKQQRQGFITVYGQLGEYSHDYKQKSSYDKKNRRSKDNKMFGYYALPKDTKWAFSVEIESDVINIELIKKTLLESTRLGKSRSAEYGHICIEEDTQTRASFEQDFSPIKIRDKKDEKDTWYIFLYAQSRLALTDKYGVNSYQPTLESLGLESGTIAWKKSQIRTNRYTPYVSIRNNRDPERLIIEKGSIIAVEVDVNFDVKAYGQKIEKGLGLYLSEGHGRVLINPTFLTTQQPKFKEASQFDSNKVSKNYGTINSWLQEQQDEEEKAYKVLMNVKEFIKNNHNDITNKKSQWGQIRSRCSMSQSNEDIYIALFGAIEDDIPAKGFLLHGRAKEKWSSKLIDEIKNKYKEERDYLNFIKLLSIHAPKVDDKKEEIQNV